MDSSKSLKDKPKLLGVNHHQRYNCTLCSLCTYVLYIYIIAQMKANIPEIFGLYFRLFTLNYISLIENNGIISGNEKLSSVFDNGFSNEKTYKHL